MSPLRRHAHRAGAGLGWATAVAVGLVLSVPTAAYAQNRPPLPNEPVALEGTTKQFYRGLNVVIVKTKDGVEHAYQFTKNLIVHGGKKPAVGVAEGSRERSDSATSAEDESGCR